MRNYLGKSHSGKLCKRHQLSLIDFAVNFFFSFFHRRQMVIFFSCLVNEELLKMDYEVMKQMRVNVSTAPCRFFAFFFFFFLMDKQEKFRHGIRYGPQRPEYVCVLEGVVIKRREKRKAQVGRCKGSLVCGSLREGTGGQVAYGTVGGSWGPCCGEPCGLAAC